MKTLSLRTIVLVIGGLAVLAGFIFIPPTISPYWLGILTMVLMWAAMSSSFNILGGFAGQVCFISALYTGIGAYFTTVLLLTFNISPWIGMFIAAGVATLVALGVGYLFFRYGLRDVYFALGTMAVLTITTTVFLNLPGFGGALGLNIIIDHNDLGKMLFREKLPYYYIMLGLFVAIVAICLWMSRSKLGYWFRAIRENQEAAESLGVNVMAYKMLANAMAAFLLGLGGGFWALYVTYIDPYTAFLTETSALIIIIMVAGGSGTVIGPLLGSVVLVPLTEVVRAQIGQRYPGSHLVIYGAILMIIILYLPDGFAGVLQRLKKRILSTIQQSKLTENVKYAVKDLFEPESQILKEVLAEDTIAGSTNGTSGLVIVPPGNDEIMRVDNVSRLFGGLKAVNGVSFSVCRGQIFGIIGPNGAGKTTTFNLLSGSLPPTEGKIYLKGEDVTGLMPHTICSRGLGRTFQITQTFPKMTVLETVMVGALMRYPKRPDAERKAYKILKAFSMLEKASTLSENLTLADRKRLEIAKAMATDPEIILLDEVVAGLTEVEVDDVVSLLKHINREYGVTIVMIEHVMRAINALCDHVVVLDFGKMIANGSPEEITSNPAVIEAYLGTELEASHA